LLRLSGSLELEALQPHHIRRMVAQLHADGLQGRTIAHMLSAWRGLFRWLTRHHGFQADPCAGVRAPRAAQALPEALSPDEAQRLLEAAPADRWETRDRAMFELFYSSGLRLAELIALDLADATHMRSHAEVTVTGKGGRTRTVPVGRAALKALQAWLD